MVLKCKKDRWGDREKKRLRLEREVEERMLDLLRRDRDEMLMAEESEIERRMIEEEANEKIATLSSVFEASRTQNQKKREVPDWAIDDISFDIMVDPVIVSFPLGCDIHLYIAKPNRDSITYKYLPADKNRQILRTRHHHGASPPAPLRPPHPRASLRRRPAA